MFQKSFEIVDYHSQNQRNHCLPSQMFHVNPDIESCFEALIIFGIHEYSRRIHQNPYLFIKFKVPIELYGQCDRDSGDTSMGVFGSDDSNQTLVDVYEFKDLDMEGTSLEE
jgi:hypothetical protein